MDCCLVRVLVLLLSCCAIFGCPQHDLHDQHIQQPNENSLESTNLITEDKSLLDANQLEHHMNEEAPKEETGTQTTAVNDNVSLDANTRHGSSDSSITNDNYTQPEISEQYIECVCALFSLKSPIETDAPLVSKTFHNVSCNDHISAKDACTEVCISFVTSRLGEDNSICAHLRNTAGLRGYVHSKIPEENAAWTFTGLESSRPLCCKNGRSVDCENEVMRMRLSSPKRKLSRYM